MHQNIFLRLGQTITGGSFRKRRESIVKIVDRIALILVIIGALNWGSWDYLPLIVWRLSAADSCLPSAA